MATETGDPPRDVSRRDLFKTVGAGAAAAVAGAPLAPGTAAAQAQPVAPPQLEALETLTAAEADILEAIKLAPRDQDAVLTDMENNTATGFRKGAPFDAWA